jgi:hypothetical protein
MAPKSDLHLRVAELLARPFSQGRGRASAPLSFRLLPEGGMVVITSDGRKLWFSAVEVSTALESLQTESNGSVQGTHAARSRFKPKGLMQRQQAPQAYEGMPSLIVFPPQEQKKHPNGDKS